MQAECAAAAWADQAVAQKLLLLLLLIQLCSRRKCLGGPAAAAAAAGESTGGINDETRKTMTFLKFARTNICTHVRVY